MSWIVTVEDEGLPSAAFDGLLRLTVNVSPGSSMESSVTGTEIVFSSSPGENVSVPETDV